MSMFTLAISCLTTSNLPWFMDLTFQFPMQYCSLQHRILLPSPVTSTTGWCFCFGSLFILSGVISPFFSSSILGPYQPGECHTFLPFHTAHVTIISWYTPAEIYNQLSPFFMISRYVAQIKMPLQKSVYEHMPPQNYYFWKKCWQ